jgi:hypothetical protein
MFVSERHPWEPAPRALKKKENDIKKNICAAVWFQVHAERKPPRDRKKAY